MRRLVAPALGLVGAACTLAYPLGDYTGGAPDGGASSSTSSSSSSSSGGDTPEAGVGGGDGGADGGTGDDAPMLAWASAAGMVRYRRWNTMTRRWSPAVDAFTIAGREIRNVMPRRSPITGRRVLGVYTTEPGSGASPKLDLYDWEAGKFTPIGSNTDFDSAQDRRPFDITAEGRAGRLLAVYGGAASHIPRVRVRDAKGWGNELPIFPSAPDGSTIAYIELIARPGTDDVALVYADSSLHLHAARWNGTTFEPPVLLAEKLQTNDFRAFHAAYEGQSGDLLIAWATNGSIFSTTTQHDATAISTTPESLQFASNGPIALAADPTSNRIALSALEIVCGGGGCDDFSTATWIGDNHKWTAKTTIDPDITTKFWDRKASAPTTTAWTNGKAIATYARASTGFRWALFDGNAWTLQPDVATKPAIGDKGSFVAFHSGADVVLLVSEKQGALWAKRYDGTMWSDTEDGAPLAADLPNADTVHGIPFGMDVP